MPKRLNPILQLKAAEKRIAELAYGVERMKGFTLQQSLDMAQITLHEHFGFGPGKCRDFGEKFRQTFLEYAELCLDDGKDDEEIVYTKAVVDRALRAACGEILPFDERYQDENLYYKRKD